MTKATITEFQNPTRSVCRGFEVPKPSPVGHAWTDGLSLAERRGLGRAAGGEDELGLERRGAALLAGRETPGDDGRGDGARADHADGGGSLVHILVRGRFLL